MAVKRLTGQAREPYRYACPKDHRTVYRLKGNRYKCQTCSLVYDGKPRDLKRE